MPRDTLTAGPRRSSSGPGGDREVAVADEEVLTGGGVNHVVRGDGRFYDADMAHLARCEPAFRSALVTPR
ncbi:hypothetical protein ABT120_53180 [Nonomuraea angiospora]|uniref:hypothetical protein n=1 Tax=Nonomuraea angiospora TaxID=46172 RepID=UPI00332D87D1